MNTSRPRRLLACASLCALLSATLPSRAGAITYTIDAELTQAQLLVEQTAAQEQAAREALQETEQTITNIETSIGEVEGRIADAEAQLAGQQERTASAMRAGYKVCCRQLGLVDLLLCSESFDELLATVRYLNAVEGLCVQEMDRLADLALNLQSDRATLGAAKASAEELKAQAEQRAQEAEQAAEAAITARVQAQEESTANSGGGSSTTVSEQAVAGTSEETTSDAEGGAAQPSTEAPENSSATPSDAVAPSGDTVDSVPGTSDNSDGSSASDTTSSPSSGATSSPTTPSSSSSSASTDIIPVIALSAVDWSIGRDAFVSQWGARIDAFLAGSPLAGHGTTFAEAAWDYGVDPRWSPAIAHTESSKGRNCFTSHNAWGWGNVSWPDWDTAIRAHVSGLARVYGSAISPAATRKYCPPNPASWYKRTATVMASI